MIKTVILALGAAFILCPLSRLNAQVIPPPPAITPQTGLTLSNLLQLVLERNEALQAKLIDYEASHQKHLAERGIFEPDLVGSVNHEVNNRPNNAQQQNEDQNSILHESNNIYDGGIESLLPTGTKLHLGYNLSDLQNNILPSGLFSSTLNSNLNQLQYQSFFGVTVDQPLLKNFGPAVTMAGMRVAALQSKIAFQEYRKELMAIMEKAEDVYWELYFRQMQVHDYEISLASAETILRDTRTRFEAGKSAQVDVAEAEANVAKRRGNLAQARQALVAAANELDALCAGRRRGTSDLVRAVDVPVFHDDHRGFEVLSRDAFENNPEYLIQQQKVDQELIRLGYARNQRLPEFDLKGAYGLNGLGATPGESWDDIQRSHYPSWTIGAEFRIPLGMTKVRHEYTAAEMQLQSAETMLQSLQTQIFNKLDTLQRDLETQRDAVGSYLIEASYRRKVYDDAVVSQKAGKLETFKVFDFEDKWLEAGGEYIKAMLDYQRASRVLQIISGTFLQQRNIELTQDDLQRSTRDMMKHGRLKPNGYLQGNNEQNAFYPAGSASRYDDAAIRNALHERERELDQPQQQFGH